MRVVFLLFLIFSFLYSSDNRNQEWTLKIFFDVKGGWGSFQKEKGNYELKILFEGWLFKDNGDYGISFLKDLREDKTYYWKLEKKEGEKITVLSENIRPNFYGGVSIRNGNENFILLRICAGKGENLQLVLPSSNGFAIIERNDDYDQFVVSGSNKLSFKDEELKKEFVKKFEWEWKKTIGDSFSYHKVKAFMSIKPNF